MNTLNERMLTAAELVAALNQSPQAVVARMSHDERKGLLQDICLGATTVTEPIGAALLEALRLQPQEVGAALAHVEQIRRKNAEGLVAWERLEEFEAALKPLIEALTAKAVEVFGPEWELIRPIPFSIDWNWDRVDVNNAPVLQPLADAVTAAMQGRNLVARVAQRFEQQLDVRDLLALVDRRRELAAEAARRAS